MKYLLIGFVKAWRAVISPLYGDVCKYYPSCSAYGLEALQLHGAFKGSWLIVRRLARCHPWSKGGIDPVPESPLEARIAAGVCVSVHDRDFLNHDHEGTRPQRSAAGSSAVTGNAAL